MKSSCCDAYCYLTEEVVEDDNGEPYTDQLYVCEGCGKRCEVKKE